MAGLSANIGFLGVIRTNASEVEPSLEGRREWRHCRNGRGQVELDRAGAPLFDPDKDLRTWQQN
jgi:hypothetical protein